MAERALSAMLGPGCPTEASYSLLVGARLGEVVADGVGLAWVGSASWAALALGHHRELAVSQWAGEWPAIHLSPLWPRAETVVGGWD